MSKGDNFESLLVWHIFQNGTVSGVGDSAGLLASAAVGNLYISLHTADPGETGDQTTSEATYTGYARTAVARTVSGWTTFTNTATNAAIINCPACTGGSNTITYFGIGTLSAGAGVLLYSGILTASLAVSNGITPSFAVNAITVTED